MYEKMLTEGQIGRLSIKNKTVMTAMGVSLAHSNGEASDDIIRYYEERAKGGCGLIITEVTRVDDETGAGTSNQLSVTDAKFVPRLQRLVDTVHKYDTKIFFQLHHPGRQTSKALTGGRQVVAPSEVMCQMMQEMPRALSTEECEAMRNKFIMGAVLSQLAGADGVELHCAHGYLLNEFLSPYTNKRTDQYGGSDENRLRLVAEIIGGIRQACGPHFPISVRLSADEFVEGGLKIEDTLKIAKSLEALGIDCLNISTGIYESMNAIVEPGSYAQGWKKQYAKAVKEQVSIPVIAVNNIKDPQVAEALLDEGVCDYIGLGRALLADPEWVNKTAEGREDTIRKCIGCLYCFEGLGQGKHIACSVNPRLGRECEYSHYSPARNHEKVLVIGGGPAGMEAALTLDKRGYKVTLIEGKDQLGGTLNLADKPLLKEKITALTEGMVAEIKASDVEVSLNVKDALMAAQQLQPYAVFLATGAKAIRPSFIEGINQEFVVTAEEVLAGKAKVSGKVAVIGSGMTGIETAELLAEQGCKVSLIEMQEAVGPGIYPPALMDVLTRFNQYGPEILTSHQLLAIGEQTLTLKNLKEDQTLTKAVDYVVLSLGVRPDSTLKEQFKKAFDKLYVVGDASQAGRILQAMADGHGKASVLR